MPIAVSKIMHTMAKQDAEKSLLPVDRGPQRLKPDLFSINYVRPKGHTLQQPEFFSSL